MTYRYMYVVKPLNHCATLLGTLITISEIFKVSYFFPLNLNKKSYMITILSSRFFESEPDLKSLFPKIVKMNNENQLEYDIDREMLQRHAVTVLEGLGAAVESLEESDFLNSVLISIGQTHVQRHVKPNMLRVG